MPRTLKQHLSASLSVSELSRLYSGFDTIGDIAIIKIPDPLYPRKKLIGQAVLEKTNQIKVVLMQRGPVRGEFRTRELEHIAGEDRTSTVYKEHGCTFLVDVAKSYFSPRLSTERLRIAKLVQKGDRVLNMFAGVGAFSIVIAKAQPYCRVVNIEINQEAHRFAIENSRINKVGDRVKCVLGDARKIIKHGEIGKFSRVLMPLPERSSEFLEDAISSLDHTGGWIHFYTHVHASDQREALTEASGNLHAKLEDRGKVEWAKVVREVGPRFYQVVVDIIF